MNTVKSEKENLVSFTENGKVSPNRLIFPSLAPIKITHDKTAAKVFLLLILSNSLKWKKIKKAGPTSLHQPTKHPSSSLPAQGKS